MLPVFRGASVQHTLVVAGRPTRSLGFMRFTDQPEFDAALRAEAEGDWVTAKANLERLRMRLLDAGEDDQACQLLHSLGDIEVQLGNIDQAHSHYRELLSSFPCEPFPRIFYARALVRYLGDPVRAAQQLGEAEQLFASGEWRLTAGSEAGVRAGEFEIPREIEWIKNEIAGPSQTS